MELTKFTCPSLSSAFTSNVNTVVSSFPSFITELSACIFLPYSVRSSYPRYNFTSVTSTVVTISISLIPTPAFTNTFLIVSASPDCALDMTSVADPASGQYLYGSYRHATEYDCVSPPLLGSSTVNSDLLLSSRKYPAFVFAATSSRSSCVMELLLSDKMTLPEIPIPSSGTCVG